MYINDNIYDEDVELNEGIVSSGIKAAVKKFADRKAAKAAINATLSNPSGAASNVAKKTLIGTTREAINRPGNGKKVAATLAGAGILGNMAVNDREALKNTAGTAANLIPDSIKLTGAVLNTGTKIVDTAASTIDTGKEIAAEADRQAREATARADQRWNKVKRTATDAYNSVKDNVKKGVDAVNNSSTATKAGIGVGAAGAIGAAALVAANSLKNKQIRLDGCSEIKDPDEKAACQSKILRQKKVELQTKLVRCKHANDPKKCKEEMMKKIESIEKQLAK